MNIESYQNVIENNIDMISTSSIALKVNNGSIDYFFDKLDIFNSNITIYQILFLIVTLIGTIVPVIITTIAKNREIKVLQNKIDDLESKLRKKWENSARGACEEINRYLNELFYFARRIINEKMLNKNDIDHNEYCEKMDALEKKYDSLEQRLIRYFNNEIFVSVTEVKDYYFRIMKSGNHDKLSKKQIKKIIQKCLQYIENEKNKKME